MPSTKVPYTCYRCSYNTIYKGNMRRHLYSKGVECPGIANDIELTAEIKEKILKNRVHHEPKPNQQHSTVNTTQLNCIIHNINQQKNIINVLNGFDISNKVSALANRDGIEIQEFEDFIEEHYKKNVDKLLNDSYRHPVEYTDTNFKEMVFEITESSDLTSSVILSDKKKDAIYVSIGNNEWETIHGKRKIEVVVESLVKYFLQNYEIYLIRKLEASISEVRFNECLDKYYTFIATFDIHPFVRNKEDAQVMYNEDDENYANDSTISDIQAHRIVDKYNAKYAGIKTKLSDSKRNATYKEIATIITQNTVTHTERINTRIVELLQIEPEFLQQIQNRQESEVTLYH